MLKRDKLLLVVRVDNKDVFNHEIHSLDNWHTIIVEMPIDVIPKDYKHMQIEIYRTPGEK